MNMFERMLSWLPNAGRMSEEDWQGIMRSTQGQILGRMAGTPQDVRTHLGQDVLTHARMTCAQLEGMAGWRALPPEQRRVLYLAALMHDAGKPDCTRLEDGRWTARGHEAVGARLLRETMWSDCELCGTPRTIAFRECVCALVEHHALPLCLPEHSGGQFEAARLAELGRLAKCFTLEALALLAEANVLSSGREDAPRLMRCVDSFRRTSARAGCLKGPRPEPERAPGWGPVVMVCGLPGAGKAEYARRELAHLPAVSPELRPGDMELAQEYLRAHRPFVWIARGLTPGARARQIALCQSRGAAVHLVYLETTLKAQQRRIEARSCAVPDMAIADMRRGAVPPSPCEAAQVEWVCT